MTLDLLRPQSGSWQTELENDRSRNHRRSNPLVTALLLLHPKEQTRIQTRRPSANPPRTRRRQRQYALNANKEGKGCWWLALGCLGSGNWELSEEEEEKERRGLHSSLVSGASNPEEELRPKFVINYTISISIQHARLPLSHH